MKLRTLALIGALSTLAFGCSSSSEGEVPGAEETTVAEETREAEAVGQPELAIQEDPPEAPEAEAPEEETPEATPPSEAAAGWDPVALSRTVDPSLRAVPDETPAQSVARCEGTSDPDTCVALALDPIERLRAQERQRLIDAHRALGNEDRMLDQMEAFLADYPRDRRGNRIRIRLQEAGRI